MENLNQNEEMPTISQINIEEDRIKSYEQKFIRTKANLNCEAPNSHSYYNSGSSISNLQTMQSSPRVVFS